MPLATFPKCFLPHLTDGRMSHDEWIDMAEDFDVDGLELYFPALPESHDALARLRNRVEAQGRVVPMICASPDFTVEAGDARTHEIEREIQAIRASAALGAGYCRVLSGQRRPGLSVDDGIDRVCRCIDAVLPEAEASGVVLILENHYKDGHWDYPEFAQHHDVFLALLDALPDTPWLGVNYDPSNAVVAGDDPYELLDAVVDRVVTMHASDRYFEGGTIDDLKKLDADPHAGYATILKHGVVGRGLNDYDRIFSTLKRAGFSGWVSIEDGDDPTDGPEHLRESAVFLRGKMAEHGLV